LAEGVEFVESPFGGGVPVGLDDGEVGESLQRAPELRCWTLTGP
jgi:hypothetical protein